MKLSYEEIKELKTSIENDKLLDEYIIEKIVSVFDEVLDYYVGKKDKNA